MTTPINYNNCIFVLPNNHVINGATDSSYTNCHFVTLKDMTELVKYQAKQHGKILTGVDVQTVIWQAVNGNYEVEKYQELHNVTIKDLSGSLVQIVVDHRSKLIRYKPKEIDNPEVITISSAFTLYKKLDTQSFKLRIPPQTSFDQIRNVLLALPPDDPHYIVDPGPPLPEEAAKDETRAIEL